MADEVSKAEARIDDIEKTWASASDESLKGMLEKLRVVIEDEPSNWKPTYLDKAHRLVGLIVDKLPAAADVDTEPS